MSYEGQRGSLTAPSRAAAAGYRAYTDEDDMVLVRGRVGPEAGAALLRAFAGWQGTGRAPASYAYSRAIWSAYLSWITRRLSLRVGVSSPPSTEKGSGTISKRLICS